MPVLVFTGHCETNEILMGEDFQWYYQRAYVAMYVICLIVVGVLYTLIFISVTIRRNRKQRQRCRQQIAISNTAATPTPLLVTCVSDSANDRKAAPLPVTTTASVQTTATAVNESTICLEIESLKGDGISSSSRGGGGPDATAPSVCKNVLPAKAAAPNGSCPTNRQQQQESTFLANLRTALMLFVVTLVFIVTFTPGFLMTLDWLPFNMTIFYMYFANNCANPVIYSFMNRNFRADLRRIICHRK